jgi:hypothetical protein
MIFGNPSSQSMERIQHSILLQEWKAAGILQPLMNMPYPCEMTTLLELQSLVPLVQGISPDRLEHCLVVDEYLYEMWSIYAQSYGVSYTGDQLHQWVLPYEPLIDFLKLHYNRPRPFQVAGLHSIPLFPHVKEGSTEAAYPSGHTFLSAMIAGKLSLLHPEMKSDWWWMVMDIKRGREELGVHYPSDGLFALQVYKQLKGMWYT